MDVVLLGFIGGYIYGGWRTGFVRRLFGLAFLALSFVLGAYVRQPAGAIAGQFLKDVPPGYADMVGYSVAFPVILAAAHLISRPFLNHVAVGGMSKRVDQALGAIFGGVEAILIVSVAVVILDTYFASVVSIGQNTGLGFLKQVRDALEGSGTVHVLRDTTVPVVLAVLGPLLPKDISSLLPSGLPAGLPSGFPLPTP